MAVANFLQLGVTDIVRLIRERRLSPVELVQAYPTVLSRSILL